MASLVVASSDANAFNQVWADPTYKFYNYFAVNSFFLNTIGGSAVTQGQFNQFGGYLMAVVLFLIKTMQHTPQVLYLTLRQNLHHCR